MPRPPLASLDMPAWKFIRGIWAYWISTKILCAGPYILTLIAGHGFNLLYTGNPETGLKNSEDPNEMLHNAAFHLGIHCLLW